MVRTYLVLINIKLESVDLSIVYKVTIILEIVRLGMSNFIQNKSSESCGKYIDYHRIFLMEWYPRSLRVDSHGSQSTIDFLVRNFERNSLFHYAEFGIYEGSTAKAIASYFPNAILHLFDFHNVLDQFSRKHPEFGNRIQFYGNTQKYNDSYNWNLSKLLHQGDIRFDYIFLDGASHLRS
jgi:hypothetical protein